MTPVPCMRDDTPASPFEELPEVVEFRAEAGHASYHHADDSAQEWHLAKPHQQRCQEIFDAAAPGLKAYLAGIKGEYLISIRTHAAPSRDLIGREVVYRPMPDADPEQGTVTSVNDWYVFVRFRSPTPQACKADDLELLDGSPAAQPRTVEPKAAS